MTLPVEWLPSPNFGERLTGPTDILVLHYTGMDSEGRALKWLRDPESSVSAHYFVFEDGRIARLVDEEKRAWHAGRSHWQGETDINSRSIGIEIANPGHEYGYRAFPDVQIGAVIGLCRDILARHPIPSERVLAHSDVAPTRKDDPGELFPWARLAAVGIGIFVPPAPIVEGPGLRLGDRGMEIADLKDRFRKVGYGLGPESEFDVLTEAVVRAFQRRYRTERVDGVADPSTMATLDRLLAVLPPKP
ncbi:MAG: N-acetylmuramoyl-L-alanine amidase [Rhizobiales bacterium]|nr:N-acetylmuramoyl-L-alanine amidase [Hyphomicrobiales bacterium]